MSVLHAELADHGLPPIRFGIGLHCGTVVAAHVGTAARRQYSVIGDTVNVGSRLCSQAGVGEIVASDAVWNVVPDRLAVRFAPPEQVVLKGMSTPITIHRTPVADGSERSVDASASTGQVPPFEPGFVEPVAVPPEAHAADPCRRCVGHRRLVVRNRLHGVWLYAGVRPA